LFVVAGVLCFSSRFWFGPFLPLLVLLFSACSLPLRGRFVLLWFPSSLLVCFCAFLCSLCSPSLLGIGLVIGLLPVRSFLSLCSVSFCSWGLFFFEAEIEVQRSGQLIRMHKGIVLIVWLMGCGIVSIVWLIG
jgi:hypothetical protein